ncbi:MAG: hypothetical protein NC453_23005 [Muribaculum sp.]|nr:hypothetical protein [Muribaculum sp.]
MSYIGTIGAERLDPERRFNLNKAEQMFSEEYDPMVIKIQTGWEMGIDGKWRYEIADPFLETTAIEDYVKPRFGEPINIKFILRDTRILTAYPEFEKLSLYAIYSPKTGVAGYYNPETNGIVISMGTPKGEFEYQIDGVLLHEIQHLIQEIEGFAKGGDPKTLGRLRYMRMAGEVEARNIPSRHFLTEDERRRSLRTNTQDVPDNKQIVKF